MGVCQRASPIAKLSMEPNGIVRAMQCTRLHTKKKNLLSSVYLSHKLMLWEACKRHVGLKVKKGRKEIRRSTYR
jgi:hypothetical protein